MKLVDVSCGVESVREPHLTIKRNLKTLFKHRHAGRNFSAQTFSDTKSTLTENTCYSCHWARAATTTTIAESQGTELRGLYVRP